MRNYKKNGRPTKSIRLKGEDVRVKRRERKEYRIKSSIKCKLKSA